MAVDKASVYWTVETWSGSDRLDESIMKAPIEGGDATTLAPTHEPHAIAVDGTSVYWLDAGGLMKISADGGEPNQLADANADPEGWTTIAVDATNVYWFDFWGRDSQGFSIGRTIRSVPAGGGASSILLEDNDGVAGVAVDATSFFWEAYSGNGLEIVRTPFARTAQTPPSDRGFSVARQLDTVQSIVVDANSVYWGGKGSIMKAPLDGGSPTKLASTGGRFVIDQANVYWAVTQTETNNRRSGSILMAPLEGGAATTLATGEDSPDAIAVDETSVYWVNDGSGELRRRPKP
jgi:hypothetical protein